MKQQKFRLGLAVSLWAALLVVLALEPGSAVETCLPANALRNAAHAAAYGIFGFVLCLFCRFKRTLLGFHMTARNLFFFAVLPAVLWGGVTEALQYFTNGDRIPSLGDLGFDVAGILAGYAAFLLFSKWLHHGRKMHLAAPSFAPTQVS